MRLVKAKIGYGVKFDPEQQKQLAKAIIFSLHPVEFEEDGTYKTWYQYDLVDVDLFPLHAMASLSDVTPIQIPGIAEALIPRENTVINQKTHVSVPGFGLMAIREVEVRTDMCTEELQRELDRGWQILAICVQPDQRRPDYVLGRPKKLKDEA